MTYAEWCKTKCTAPTRDQFEQELAERIEKLEALRQRFSIRLADDKPVGYEITDDFLIARLEDLQHCAHGERISELERENAELRKALEDMPHTKECLSNGYWRYTVDGGYIPSDESRCNCPKSRALNSPRIEPSNG